MIFTHPVTREFHPVHHPSYVDFYEEVLARDDRPGGDREALREAATPRTSGTATCTGRRYAYHGVHPFYMWYWGAHALQHLGDVIFVGGDPRGVPPDGLPPRRHDARRAGDGRAGRRARPVADALPLPAAVLRRGRRMRFARGGRRARAARRRQRRHASAPSASPRRWRTVSAGSDPWARAHRRGPGRGCASRRPALVREVAQQALLFPATRVVAQPTRDRRRRPDPRAAARDPRAQPRERHRHAARPALAPARLARAHRRRRRQRPLLPQARLRDRRRLLDQHVPVRPRRRPAPRPRRAAAHLRDGRNVLLFPQGTRGAGPTRATAPASPSSRSPPARRSSRSTSRAARWSCPRAAASTAAAKTTVTFARPLHPRPDETPRELTDRVQSAIAALSRRRPGRRY